MSLIKIHGEKEKKNIGNIKGGKKEEAGVIAEEEQRLEICH